MKKIEISLEFSDVDKKIEKKYSKKIIDDFKELLLFGTRKDIFLFIVKNRIPFGDLGGNFSSIAILVSKSNFNDINKFFELKTIQKKLAFIDHMKNDVDFYTKYVANLVKNTTRQKGSSHFANKIIKYLSNKTNVLLVDSDKDIKLEENTIYVSNSDKILSNILLANGINAPEKGIDIIIYINGNISFGEAKEINELGGSQKLQFNNMEDISKLENGFGIIYGNILFYDNDISRRVKENPDIYPIWSFLDNF